jgi:hypothetical protein
MHLTLFQDVPFDGTYIDFTLVVLDASGLVPQTGQSGNITTVVYDSANNPDAATVVISELGTTGVYRVRTTYSELNRAAGNGLWRWVFTHSSPDFTFKPPAVTITLNQIIGKVVTDAGNTATTFKTDRTTMPLGRFCRFINGLPEEVKKVVGFNAGTQFITVETAFSGTPANNSMFEIF